MVIFLTSYTAVNKMLNKYVYVSSDSVFSSSDLILRITNETRASANGAALPTGDIASSTDYRLWPTKYLHFS